MAMCEKCWRDAERMAEDTRRNVEDVYHELLDERRAAPCSATEQGPYRRGEGHGSADGVARPYRS